MKTLVATIAGLLMCMTSHSQEVVQVPLPVICSDANLMFAQAQREYNETPSMMWEDEAGLFVMFTSEKSMTLFVIPALKQDVACIVSVSGSVESIKSRPNL